MSGRRAVDERLAAAQEAHADAYWAFDAVRDRPPSAARARLAAELDAACDELRAAGDAWTPPR